MDSNLFRILDPGDQHFGSRRRELLEHILKILPEHYALERTFLAPPPTLNVFDESQSSTVVQWIDHLKSLFSKKYYEEVDGGSFIHKRISFSVLLSCCTFIAFCRICLEYNSRHENLLLCIALKELYQRTGVYFSNEDELARSFNLAKKMCTGFQIDSRSGEILPLISRDAFTRLKKCGDLRSTASFPLFNNSLSCSLVYTIPFVQKFLGYPTDDQKSIISALADIAHCETFVDHDQSHDLQSYLSRKIDLQFSQLESQDNTLCVFECKSLRIIVIKSADSVEASFVYNNASAMKETKRQKIYVCTILTSAQLGFVLNGIDI